MDEKIDDMIPENIQPVEIVIHGKGEIWNGPLPPGAARNTVKALPYLLPGQGLYLNAGILNYIYIIIKMPWTTKTVRICDQQYEKQEACGKQRGPPFFERPFHVQIKIFSLIHDTFSYIEEGEVKGH